MSHYTVIYRDIPRVEIASEDSDEDNQAIDNNDIEV